MAANKASALLVLFLLKFYLTKYYNRGYYIGRKSKLHKKVVGACKKIVRLILMSNISRRKFLKGAGVAALAVAASGVLAGCSGSTDSKPVVPPVKNPTKEEMILAAIDPEGKLTQTDVLDADTLYLLLAYIEGKQTNDMNEYQKLASKSIVKPVQDKTYVGSNPIAWGISAEDFSADAVKEALASYKYGNDATLADIVVKEAEGIVYFAIMPVAVL